MLSITVELRADPPDQFEIIGLAAPRGGEKLRLELIADRAPASSAFAGALTAGAVLAAVSSWRGSAWPSFTTGAAGVGCRQQRQEPQPARYRRSGCLSSFGRFSGLGRLFLGLLLRGDALVEGLLPRSHRRAIIKTGFEQRLEAALRLGGRAPVLRADFHRLAGSEIVDQLDEAFRA